MTVDEIKELIEVVNESGIAELEVQRGDVRVRIRRGDVAPAPSPEVVVTPAAQALPPSSTLLPVNEEAELVFVKSPIVGTYYDSPTPGSPPFVKVGDRVGPGQVLCIIESMKLMNEIEAEVAGIIDRKLVDNGRPVEYGEALFGVRPA